MKWEKERPESESWGREIMRIKQESPKWETKLDTQKKSEASQRRWSGKNGGAGVGGAGNAAMRRKERGSWAGVGTEE
jgi:hypothetical protein